MKRFEKKITISTFLYQTLISDMEYFGLDKKRNQNDFFSRVIINTYRYQNKINTLNKIKSILKDLENELPTNELIKSINTNKNKINFEQQLTDIALKINGILYCDACDDSNNKKFIYIRETKKNNSQIERIINESATLSAASVLKYYLFFYMSFPLYIREKIYYLDTFEVLQSYIDNKILCHVTTNNKSYDFKIYSIIRGKEEFHYYIVGYIQQQQKEKLLSIKLTSIKNYYSLNSSFIITESEINEINEKKFWGAEWIGEKIIKCKVQFDEKGIKKYYDFYKDRPYGILNEETKIIDFVCPKTQLVNYLRLFGKHAIVLDNPLIRKGLETFYDEAKKAYTNI